jgi:hypothetical protein
MATSGYTRNKANTGSMNSSVDMSGGSVTPPSDPSSKIFLNGVDTEPNTDATPARIKRMYSEPTDQGIWMQDCAPPDREGQQLTSKKV